MKLHAAQKRKTLDTYDKKGKLTSRMLYDHKADHGENVNVAGTRKDSVGALSGELRKRTGTHQK
jgi:hypothetical protein